MERQSKEPGTRENNHLITSKGYVPTKQEYIGSYSRVPVMGIPVNKAKAITNSAIPMRDLEAEQMISPVLHL